MTSIGERVRAERKLQGMSRQDLARATGMGYSTLAELENGRMRSTTKLHAIADALAVSAAWLETGRGTKRVDAAEFLASQLTRFDDATMAQAIDLLYQIADHRPDDHRFARLTWPMIQVAAKAVARAAAGESQRKIIADMLAEIDQGV
ncbi:helix-turn-helix domain-containing protein [Tahibacter harae]|uniref:Helix-turn-helix domain-containing protein n=1 Tax=Tahibacter harae TaxID=2963937 RepID=A0ABT1QS57_9GAMM|nr:helix-turn-helix transcriptional regulator [Tahibacter harae]MCQ4165115.1 helix-turn-helix domain-containing protein [Tahibacter harae]